MAEKSDLQVVLDIFQDNKDTQLRLQSLKTRLNLHEDDAIWLYIAALENYQRLFEAQPKYLIESANAERERMQAETNKIIASTHEQISKIASEITASASKKLVENVEKAVVNRSEKALLRERGMMFLMAFSFSAAACVFAGSVGGSNFAFIARNYFASDNYLIRGLLMMWEAPAGWVFVAGTAGVAFSYFTELSALTARKKLYDRQP